MNYPELLSERERPSSISLNLLEAFAAIALIGIAAHGYPADGEAKSLYATLSSMQLFASLSPEVMQRMLEKLQDILRHQGFVPLFKAAQACLPSDLYQTALVLTNHLIVSGEGHGNCL
ncbi:MAG: Tellurite resistance protein TerB [Chloroflexaceae bacterium]|nr:Tellurite resistance protein TerB [Chloroflexaceae bacterium]